jgi:hypothetical protein
MFRIIVKTSGARPTRPGRPPIVALRVKTLDAGGAQGESSRIGDPARNASTSSTICSHQIS